MQIYGQLLHILLVNYTEEHRRDIYIIRWKRSTLCYKLLDSLAITNGHGRYFIYFIHMKRNEEKLLRFQIQAGISSRYFFVYAWTMWVFRNHYTFSGTRQYTGDILIWINWLNYIVIPDCVILYKMFENLLNL